MAQNPLLWKFSIQLVVSNDFKELIHTSKNLTNSEIVIF